MFGTYVGQGELLVYPFVEWYVDRNLAIEIEGAFIGAELEKSATNTSAMPRDVAESGLGDVEGQLALAFSRRDVEPAGGVPLTARPSFRYRSTVA